MEAIKAAAAVTTATEGRSPAEPLPLPTRRFGGRMYLETARLLAMLDDSNEAGADR